MRRGFVLTILNFLIFSSLFAQGGKIFSTTTGSIHFKSDAPFEMIKASSKEMAGLLDVQKKTYAFKVRIQTFEGFNSDLQKVHFNENYMQSNQYPDAFFSGKIIEDINLNEDGFYQVRAKGKLTLHGVGQERIIKTDITVKQGKIVVKSAFTVLLEDHNIPIPKVVKDKLANEIKVDVSAQLTPR